MTFEAETTSHDANTISVAQKICDRFLKSVREIAVAKIARLRDCKIAFADKLRDIMKGLNVEPQNLIDQQQLKDAAAAIASGAPKTVAPNYLGCARVRWVGQYVSPNNTD